MDEGTRTADDDTEEDAHDEVPDGHDNHDADDRDVLRPVDAVPSVPERLLDEVDAKDEDECADHHDRYAQHQCAVLKGIKRNARIYAIGPVPTSNRIVVVPASMKPEIRVSPPTR